VIFEDHPPNLVRVCSRILHALGEFKSPKDTKISRVVRPPLLDCNLAVGFFYGASQDRGAKCGAGVVLKCPVLGTYRLKMNCGRGTNTRGELLALWCILHFAYYKKVTRLQLVGDSKVIIDWFNNDNNLQVVSL
jgi:hypothetical protein